MNSKHNLRKHAKKIRESLDIEQISIKICQNLREQEIYSTLSNIFCYYSFGSEVSTHSLFKDNTKNWYIPRVNGDYLDVCRYNSDCLESNSFGIMEPHCKICHSDDKLDAVILPGLSFDKKGGRLGYGKGYYDKFLNGLSYNPLKIAFVPEELLVDEVPTEKHDCKVNIIITQCNTYII